MVPSWQELLSVKRNYWVIPLLPVFYLLFGPKKREEEKGMCILGPEEAQIWVTKRVVMKINGKLTVGIIVAFSPKTLK